MIKKHNFSIEHKNIEYLTFNNEYNRKIIQCYNFPVLHIKLKLIFQIY